MYRMQRNKSFAIFLSLVVGIMMLFGSMLHAIIPHTHTGNETIWTDLHASLRHEDKKVVALASSAIETAFSLALIVVLVLFGTLSPQPQFIRDDTLDRALRRGIFAYRKFR